MSLNLVTAHTGSGHVTVEEWAQMIAGLIGDDSIVYRCNLGNAMAITTSGALQFSIATGNALAGGRHFYIDEESQIVDIDPCSTGYSRIDDIYVVFYQDTTNNYDSMDIVTCHGTEYSTGGTEVEPATPPTIEGYTTVAYYKILRVYVSDSTISTYTDYTYLLGGYKELTDNLADAESTIINEIGVVSEQIASDLQDTIAEMKETFQDGVDLLYTSLVTKGVTPPSSTPEGISEGIDTYGSNQYTTGYNDGYGRGYPLGKAQGLLEGAQSVSIKAMTGTVGGTTTAGGYTYLSIDTNNPGASIGAITNVGSGVLYNATITSVSNGVVNVRIDSDAGYSYSIQATTYKLVSDYL